MNTVHVVADSISLYYGPYLEKCIHAWCRYSRKEAQIGAIMNPEGENGGDSNMILAYLERCIRQGFHWDALVVNCGLHDIRRYKGQCQVDIAQYEKNLDQLFQNYSHVADRLVWLRTTPVVDDLHNSISTEFQRFNADVEAYNAAADRVAAASGAWVIDMYAFCTELGGPEIYRDHVHFTDQISATQGAFIAGQISAYLELSARQRKRAESGKLLRARNKCTASANRW